jgi:hypothetical protein
VFQRGGIDRVPGAQVTIAVSGRVFHITTNDQGNYSLSFVPLGQVQVRAEAPVGYDRGEAAPVSGTQAGGTITANVTLAGVGTVSGPALDNNGSPVSAGTVTFTNNAWSQPIVLYAAVQPNGTYEIAGAPAGHFSLRLTVPGRVGVGSASGDVVAGQTTNVPLQLEDAGSVTGRIAISRRFKSGAGRVGVGDAFPADGFFDLLRSHKRARRLDFGQRPAGHAGHLFHR